MDVFVSFHVLRHAHSNLSQRALGTQEQANHGCLARPSH